MSSEYNRYLHDFLEAHVSDYVHIKVIDFV
jgi:hypothetical protein